jgi:hypothetical protein
MVATGSADVMMLPSSSHAEMTALPKVEHQMHHTVSDINS